MTLEQSQAGLSAIAAEVNACALCPLHEGRTHAVPGAGQANAEILFIGEGPGFHEDNQGLPFVGPSGQLLSEFLGLIKLTRDQVFITNVVKCRPPGNRDPLPVEIDTCTTTYLFRQIELINPKIVVTLGRYSMGLFFPKAKITQIHGQPKKENGRIYLPLFHPAAVLRAQALRPQAEEDFKKIPMLLAEIKADKAAGKGQEQDKKDDREEPQNYTQLSLF